MIWLLIAEEFFFEGLFNGLFGSFRDEDPEKEGIVFICPICQATFTVQYNLGLAQSNHYRTHNIDTKLLSRRQVSDEEFLLRYVLGMHRCGKWWGVLYRKLDRWWNM